MSHQPQNKAELMNGIHSTWNTLQAYLNKLSDEATTIVDHAGWTVVDHLHHLTAWEKSALFFLHGKPRHLALGVSRTLWQTSDIAAINDAVYQQSHSLNLVEARTQLQFIHDQLLQALDSLTDTDLQKPYSYYQPHATGDVDSYFAINVVYANTTEHYHEHLTWLQQITTNA